MACPLSENPGIAPDSWASGQKNDEHSWHNLQGLESILRLFQNVPSYFTRLSNLFIFMRITGAK
jgi:hypothetical protein